MEKVKYTIVALMIFIGVALIVKSHHSKKVSNQKNEIVESDEEIIKKDLTNHVLTTVESKPLVSSGVETPKENYKDIQELGLNDSNLEWGQKNYSESLKTLSTCLKINTDSSNNSELSANQFLDHISKSLGNTDKRYPEWSQTDILTADGVKRRLRVEYEYDENYKVFSTIQSFRLNEKGQVESENMDMEKSINPTNEYIDSLKTEGEIIIDEKSERINFPKGEELMIITRNGKIESISMLKDGKTVSCSGLDKTSKVNCQCL